MPKFLDHHGKMPPMSPEMMQQGQQMMQQLAGAIKAKQADKFGVTPINVFMGVNGESWCMTEAPNAEAIIKSHAANGATLTKADIVEINSLV